MKKYSSYVDLKLTKTNAYETKTPKALNSPTFRRALALDFPVMTISKDSFPIPATAKYSAGYLQRKKIFSSKKDQKDSTKENQALTINENVTNKQKLSSLYIYNQKQTSKQKKTIKRDLPVKKEKLQLESKEQSMKKKQQRMDIQSPKGNNSNYPWENKNKSKGKDKDSKEKESLREKQVIQKQKKSKSSNTAASSLKLVKKNSEKQKKQENILDDFVTKYQPQPKTLLAQCTSDSNLMRGLTLNNSCKGYYTSTIFNSYFCTKVSSFHQICKNHLATSIDFLSYAKRTKNFIPKKPEISVCLTPTSRKTVIFDLDETLIHCNQSVDMPNDVVVQISFPNNTRIKAGLNIRPYARECLRQLSQHFEVIVFTASHECYANVIIDYLDPERKYISHRLFRDHCYRTSEGFYVKDLRILNRDLANVLLIDNAAYSYCFQPQNGVPIIPFYNNKTDWELKEVTSYLKDFIGVKNMRIKNEGYMRLSEYHRFKSPRDLINQLYM